jgi:hypothetical protein
MVALLQASLSHAVDGYKELHFGDSKQTVLESKLCTLTPRTSPIEGLEFYGCPDLKLGKDSLEAGVFFINNQFLRLSIVTPTEKSFLIAQGLTEKYGEPSSQSSPDGFVKLDSKPNSHAFLAFDHNTVFYRFSTNADMKRQALLIYTSPDYEKILLRKQLTGIHSDL